jgi:hypothetical protein
MVARVDPSVKARPHEKLRLTCVPERVHFFDAKTEEAIN